MITPEQRLPVAAIAISVVSLILAFVISVGASSAMGRRQNSVEQQIGIWRESLKGWDASYDGTQKALAAIVSEHRAMTAEHHTMKTDHRTIMATVAPPDPEPTPAPEPIAEPAEEPKAAPAKPATKPAPDPYAKAEELINAIQARISNRDADRKYLAGNLRGYVHNHAGEKCWYDQKPTRDESVSHFFKSLTGTDSVMIFEDTQCMLGSGAEQDINLRQINNVIANWYSKPDAAFMTSMDQLRLKSGMQQEGFCVQSKTYSGQAFLVDYFLKDGAVWMVVHNMALRGCQGAPRGRT